MNEFKKSATELQFPGNASQKNLTPSKLTTAKEIKKIDTKTDGISQSFGLDTHNLLEQV